MMIYNCHKGYLFVGQQRYEETLSIIKKRKIYFTINQITENTSNAKKYGLIKLFNIISSYSSPDGLTKIGHVFNDTRQNYKETPAREDFDKILL